MCKHCLFYSGIGGATWICWHSTNPAYCMLSSFWSHMSTLIWIASRIAWPSALLCLSLITVYWVVPAWLRACDYNDWFSVRISCFRLTLLVKTVRASHECEISYPVLSAGTCGASVFSSRPALICWCLSLKPFFTTCDQGSETSEHVGKKCHFFFLFVTDKLIYL